MKSLQTVVKKDDRPRVKERTSRCVARPDPAWRGDGIASEAQ